MAVPKSGRALLSRKKQKVKKRARRGMGLMQRWD